MTRKWQVTTDRKLLRRMGKLCEELGELSAVAARVIIQGIDEVDPSSGKRNRQRLEEELADVQAQIGCTVATLQLDQAHMGKRTAAKMQQMGEWELLVLSDESAPAQNAQAEVHPVMWGKCKHGVDEDDLCRECAHAERALVPKDLVSAARSLKRLASVVRKYGTCAPGALEDVADSILAVAAAPSQPAENPKPQATDFTDAQWEDFER